MNSAIELAIDMDNAVSHPHVDNFTVLLLRLIIKADSDNTMLLRNGFPVEVKMVEIYKTRCPYKKEYVKDGFRFVDFDKMAKMAIEEAY